MRRKPERLAWAALILSFGMCVSLAVGVPLAIRSILNDTTEPANLTLEVQQGTALLQRPTSPDIIAVTDRTTDLPEGSVISSDQATQANLTLRDPTSGANLVIVQLSDITNMTLLAGRRPRFDVSPNAQQLGLLVKGGRVRINILNGSPRPVAVSVRSPQGQVTFGVGTYIVEVTNEELQVTVREGQATVTAQGTSVDIDATQRASVLLGQAPQGGLSKERNVITNGNFAAPLELAWIVENDVADKSEAEGVVGTAAVAGRRATRFERGGGNHAETRLIQKIDRDVTGAAKLTLHFAVLLNYQDVPVCGSLGSECPLMLKINYRDTLGTAREWVKGFYYLPDPSPKPNPAVCVTCKPPNPHQIIPAGTWFTYDSGNLMDILAADDVKPGRITQITFYASGHSYSSAITDVELLVQD